MLSRNEIDRQLPCIKFSESNEIFWALLEVMDPSKHSEDYSLRVEQVSFNDVGSALKPKWLYLTC